MTNGINVYPPKVLHIKVISATSEIIGSFQANVVQFELTHL